jgi:hypothetical protein
MSPANGGVFFVGILTPILGLSKYCDRHCGMVRSLMWLLLLHR